MRRGGRQPRKARNDIAATYLPGQQRSADEARREAVARAAAARPAVEAARREWNRVGKRVSAAVFETYGRTCHLCGTPNSATTVDHLTPKSQGGGHTLANCRPACPSCNTGRGTRTVEEYRAHLRERGRLYEQRQIRTPSRDWFGNRP